MYKLHRKCLELSSGKYAKKRKKKQKQKENKEFLNIFGLNSKRCSFSPFHF